MNDLSRVSTLLLWVSAGMSDLSLLCTQSQLQLRLAEEVPLNRALLSRSYCL